MVDNDSVRQEDLVGNDGADAAADLGWLRQNSGVINECRALLHGGRHWYPTMAELHKFMVAVSRILVNHHGHGGTALDAMIRDIGSILQPLWFHQESSSTLPSPWYCMPHSSITHEDAAVWPHSVNILTECFHFLASLHWPQDSSDLGKYGTYCLVMLIVFEQNSGHWVRSELFTRPHSRARRPLVAGGATASNVTEIRRGCQFVHGQVRSFGRLPGGLARLFPARLQRVSAGLGTHYGYGLTPKPRESGDLLVMDALLGLFGYAVGDCPVTSHFRLTCEDGKDATPRMYFTDQDLEFIRLAERFRLTGKAPADQRLHPGPVGFASNDKATERSDPSSIWRTVG